MWTHHSIENGFKDGEKEVQSDALHHEEWVSSTHTIELISPEETTVYTVQITESGSVPQQGNEYDTYDAALQQAEYLRNNY